MKNIFVTGAAGFIGSSLVDRLLADGHAVVGWDNFSTGQPEFLLAAQQHPKFKLVRGDNLDLPALTAAMGGCDTVFHLAANADVRFGLEHPRKDLEQNTIATFNVLEAMRANGIKTIAFSSTGSVYGEASIIPTPEDHPFPIQTSLYAASKVAGEGLIHGYCEGFGFEGYIFRFVSILGERYTHGHVFDFYGQLLEHPERLKVLGDGTQRKSYLYVQDCLAAILHVMKLGTAKQARHRVETYNLGTNEYVQVKDSIGIICDTLGLTPQLEFTGGDRGWAGDNPFIFLGTEKIRATGWSPTLSIREGIVRTLRWIEKNQWVLKKKMNLVITGTRSGIGNWLALHCGGQGHEVWGISRGTQTDLGQACAERGVAFRSSRCDVSDWHQVLAFREEVGRRWQHLDALVCCAAIQAPVGPAMSVDPEVWSRNVRLNLDGTFYCIRAFHDLLSRALNRAKIICFSGGGATGPRANFSAYACAKIGVVRLVETLATEWAGQPLDINAIAPGPINTAMTDEVLSLGLARVGEKEWEQARKQKDAGGAPVEKVGGLVDFLLSSDSDGITGKLISAQWDPWPTLAGRREALGRTDIYTLRRIMPKDRGEDWT